MINTNDALAPLGRFRGSASICFGVVALVLAGCAATMQKDLFPNTPSKGFVLLDATPTPGLYKFGVAQVVNEKHTPLGTIQACRRMGAASRDAGEHLEIVASAPEGKASFVYFGGLLVDVDVLKGQTSHVTLVTSSIDYIPRQLGRIWVTAVAAKFNVATPGAPMRVVDGEFLNPKTGKRMNP